MHWALMYYLQRLRQILEERPERAPEPLVAPLPRPRSSSMVAATPSLVNTHKTQVMTGGQRRIMLRCPRCTYCYLIYILCCVLQDMSLKCNEEGKSLSTETFAKVSLTNLRRQAVPDLASDLGMNIFKKVREIHPHPSLNMLTFLFNLSCLKPAKCIYLIRTRESALARSQAHG